MTLPTVSAMLLSHNRKDETLRCLASLESQTYRPLHTVVLDNASTDGSLEAIESKHPACRIIRMPRNYGDFQGRDIASLNCTGDFILCIDNDTYMPVDTVATLVDLMLTNPQLAIVQPRLINPITHRAEGCLIGQVDVTHFRPSFVGAGALIRTSVLRQVGGFPHYLLGGGELAVSLRAIDLGYRILYYSGATIYHAHSKLNRIPQHRLYCVTKGRLQAVMSHYPGVLRPLAELICKLGSHTVSALRRGYFFRTPIDLPCLLCTGLASLGGSWRLKRSTLRLIDYLHTHLVTTNDQYDSIPLSRGYFIDMLRRRLRLRFPPTLPAHGSSDL